MQLRIAIIILVTACLCSCMESSKPDNNENVGNFSDAVCSQMGETYTVWLETELDSFKQAKFMTGGAWIHDVLQSCLDSGFSFGQGSNLLRFTKPFFNGTRDGHSMRLDVADSDYLNSIPLAAADLPDELKEQSFLLSLDQHLDTEGKQALVYLDGLNAQRTEKIEYFVFDSQFLPTADDSATYKRLFVYYPGEHVDKFIQFGLHSRADSLLSNAISMVSIEKTDQGSGEPLSPARAWFKDFWRTRDDSTVLLSTRYKETGQLESCYGCHASALIPVYPDKKLFNEAKFGKSLAAVNSIIGRYKDASIAMINSDDFGPLLGPVDYKGRDKEFFDSCSNNLDQAGIEKVKAAMNCSSCHNDIEKKSLRFPMARQSQIDRDSIVKVLIEDEKLMPPGAVLTEHERNALTNCLVLEYFQFESEQEGLLEKWLKN